MQRQRKTEVIALLAVFVGFIATPAGSDDTQQELPGWILGKGVRPADSYSLSFSQNEELCSVLRSALNAPYAFESWERSNASEIPVLLGNRYLTTEWRQKEFLLPPQADEAGSMSGHRRSLQAVVDIDNDGIPNAVYRIHSEISSHSLEELVVSTPPLPEELSDGPISYQRYVKIVGQRDSSGTVANLVLLNAATSTPQNHKYYDPYYFYDIVSHNGRQYILALRSTFWIEARISLFEYRSPRDLNLVCQFTPQFKIVW